jgi:hypothetical protein
MGLAPVRRSKRWATDARGAVGSRSEVAVDIAAMSDPLGENHKLGVLDRVDDPVIANSNTP